MLEKSQRAQLSAPPVVFGEVLYDCFPDGRTILGGAPFNVAWHLNGFGLKPLLVSRIGSDDRGNDIIEAMQQWGMDVSAVQRDSFRPTGVVNVVLDDNNQPSYDIAESQAYDYIRPGEIYGTAMDGSYGLLYHGTLGLRQPEAMSSLSIFLEQMNLPSFVDLNLRAPWWNADLVHQVLSGATWIKLNDIELADIDISDVEQPSSREHALFREYNPELVILTKGAKGAAILSAEGKVEADISENVVEGGDLVGAGDSFSAVCMLGIVKEWTSSQILERAQEFAAEICGINGATTNDKQLYQYFKAQWKL
ncbi:MAG: carbohydrate kinase [Gammaproteobacteria bacterium]|nr:carbohydrate kinase [Gammaproteobacteria bacterium]